MMLAVSGLKTEKDTDVMDLQIKYGRKKKNSLESSLSPPTNFTLGKLASS